ncbi:hypothetical protein J0H58_37075 [bacterium]|nr:hypothetical protein [bacterium]
MRGYRSSLAAALFGLAVLVGVGAPPAGAQTKSAKSPKAGAKPKTTDEKIAELDEKLTDVHKTLKAIQKRLDQADKKVEQPAKAKTKTVPVAAKKYEAVRARLTDAARVGSDWYNVGRYDVAILAYQQALLDLNRSLDWEEKEYKSELQGPRARAFLPYFVDPSDKVAVAVALRTVINDFRNVKLREAKTKLTGDKAKLDNLVERMGGELVVALILRDTMTALPNRPTTTVTTAGCTTAYPYQAYLLPGAAGRAHLVPFLPTFSGSDFSGVGLPGGYGGLYSSMFLGGQSGAFPFGFGGGAFPFGLGGGAFPYGAGFPGMLPYSGVVGGYGCTTPGRDAYSGPWGALLTALRNYCVPEPEAREFVGRLVGLPSLQ